MKIPLAIALLCLCISPASAGLLFYDGFAYTAGEKLAPRNDTTGSPNPGQHNVDYNVNWRYAGAGGAANEAPAVASGSLSYPGLLASTGNSVAHDTTMLGSARIQVTPAAISSGTVYWSGLLRVNDIGTLTSGGAGMLLAGYNINGAGPGTFPGTVGGVLRIRKDASLDQYYVGVGMNSGNAAGNVAFDTATHLAGDTVFVVGAYEFVAGANNDKAHMWINPDVSTFGAGSPPPPTLSVQPGGAVADSFASLNAFNIRNVNSVGSASVQFDELRVGNDWADVTPVPEPATWTLVAFALLGLLPRRFHRRPRCTQLA